MVLNINYPPDLKSRHGYTRPEIGFLARLLADGQARFRSFLVETVSQYRGSFMDIPFMKPLDPAAPFWRNGWFPPLDAMALYTLISDRKPGIYLEIGSGNSTKFAKKAMVDQALTTRIVSIDPQPRADIDGLVDTVIRMPLEEMEQHDIFYTLKEDDIVFFDGSHRCLQNSDVTVFFSEILPILSPKTLVGIHDVFLPRDYPPEWTDRLYSEQYLLTAYLLGAGSRSNIVFPCAYSSRMFQREIAELLPSDIVELEIAAKKFIAGTAFWFMPSS
jgi:hypothetical protein